jgi:dipeptidyl-peptidase-4
MRIATLILAALILSEPAQAQGTQADYDRALAMERRTSGKSFREQVSARWLERGDALWYRVVTGPGRSEYVFVDAATGQRTGELNLEGLAQLLAQRLGRTVDPNQLPGQPAIDPNDRNSGGAQTETEISFSNATSRTVNLFWLPPLGAARVAYRALKPGENHAQHTFTGHRWQAETEGGGSLGTYVARAEPRVVMLRDGAPVVTETETRASTPARPPVAETDEAKLPWEAFVRDHNVWLRHRATGKESPLSRDGTAANEYRRPFHFSPDGSRLVVMQIEPPQERKVTLVESSPGDQVQPKVSTYDYLKPGDRIAHPRPRLFDVVKREPIPVADALFPNPWAITHVHWLPNSSQFNFLYNERGHQLLRVVAVAAGDGTVRTLFEDRSATFLDYSQKTTLQWLDTTSEAIWASERDGWNHLYRYDARTGALKNAITHGEWVVRELEHVDEKTGTLWLRVLGQRRGEDPYHSHLARVQLDGSGFTRLTEGDGTHHWEWSPDRRYFVDTWSRADLPAVTELRRATDGARVCELEKADVTALLATGWRTPERFSAKGRDGKTDIYGILVTPSNFDPAKKYPVIEKIYAGPQDFFTPKEWARSIQMHALAELGFVVVQVDGMGTNWRSRAFHDVAWRNLKDAGLPDHIAWLRTVAATRPWMDLTRVGIYGGSAGGQNSLAALLHHGDFYRTAASDCGCHDNRMDKIWWNEAWLGLVGPHYAENSNVTHAAKLTGKLLLTVGELDRNVDPSSTLQVANALIKANKDFELLIIPGAGHGAGESPYAARRRMDFFVRNLLGKEPRAEP